MKFLEKWTNKFTKTASTAVKSEVRKTAIDLLPTLMGFGSMVLGLLIFKQTVVETPPVKPTVSNTSVTTNNYFFQQMSEEMVKKIIDKE